MSYLLRLYETYNNAIAYIGAEERKGKNGEFEVRPLLPAYHTTAQVQIEITLDRSGNIIDALPIEKSNATTIIPITEKSLSRTLAVVPHGLCDQLSYVAGDLQNYYTNRAEPEKTDKDVSGLINKFAAYQKQLNDWCSSLYAHDEVRAVLNYVNKASLIKDLLDFKLLVCDENGKLLLSCNAADAPRTYKLITGEVHKAFCRFKVQTANNKEDATYKDPAIFQSWADYCDSQDSVQGICFVNGNLTSLAKSHSKYIRSKGDGTKIISANDKDNFTYRGLFVEADEVCGIGADVSQKAHSALKWLLSRQGFQQYGYCILAWSSGNHPVPNPMDGINGEEMDEEDLEYLESLPYDTAQDYGVRLNKHLAGYKQKFSKNELVNVIALDAVSDNGRLSVSYYREFGSNEYLSRIEDWYSGCCWPMLYVKKSKDNKLHFYHMITTPSPKDIILTAYGRKADDKISKKVVSKLFPCIIERAKLPEDIVRHAIVRVSNRAGFQADDNDKNEQDWNKALEVTCALYKKLKEEECYKMALDETRLTRDYLYGRLLAVADKFEDRVLREMGEKRPTTAHRLFSSFASQPFRTWKTIYESLNPYISKLGGKSNFYTQLMDEIGAKFENADFLDNSPLSGEYLLGYHNQRYALSVWSKDEKQSNNESEETDNE